MVYKSLVLAAGLCVSSAAGRAADLQAGEPPVAPLYDWTGYYVGGQLGYGWGHTGNAFQFFIDGDPTVYPWERDGSIRYHGALGGGHLGYLYQATPNFVLGVEGAINAAGIKGDDNQAGGITNTRRIDYFGTLNARLGFASDRLFIYAIGGAAAGRASASDIQQGGSDRKFVSGWNVGGGLEQALGENWRIRAQYQYVDFGKESFTISPPGFPGIHYRHKSDDLSFQAVTLGISYRF
jgi:outer membrane immunogenic protein